MARWHKHDCATPNVVVDASRTPHCQSCGRVADIDRLAAEHVADQVPMEIPPDEPIGQMALWWPPSVPYSSSHGNHLGKRQTDRDNKASQDPTLSQPRSPAPPTKPANPAYETALSAEDFRLARFDALPDGCPPDHPIHITLEVFQRDDCPEYETASYTWGGEGNDSTACRPVFVGPYWDVLLQTSNCWDMLLYLRPNRGIRLVWIDAVCINQADPAERAHQVASMRSVYQQCSRVVIFLGADVAVPSSTVPHRARMHPARHPLHEFDQVMSAFPDEGMPKTLLALLTRRYFSRVWVIQELVLSRGAIIPIAGREFWASGITPTRYEEAKTKQVSGPARWNWESTAAPWMQNLCAGSLHATANFCDVLRRTSRCQATDPRDNIFGILGLVESQSATALDAATQEQDGSVSSSITPDYNISVRHAFIGILAHTLLNRGVTDVLIWADGLGAHTNYHSWLPDMRMHVLDGMRQERDFQPLRSPLSLGGTGSLDLMLRISRKTGVSQRSIVWLTNLSLPLLPQLHRDNKYALEFPGVDDPVSDSHHSVIKMGGRWHERQRLLPRLYALHSWRSGATVDSSTGDLLLKAGHLLQYESWPRKVDLGLSPLGLGDKAVAVYEISEGWCSLFICFSMDGPQLDKFIPAGKIHLFYLEKENDKDGPPEFLLLFLREVDGTGGSPAAQPKDFELMLCCPYLDIFLTCPQEPHNSHGMDDSLFHVNVRHSLYAVLTGVLDAIFKVPSPMVSDEHLAGFSSAQASELETWGQLLPGCDRSNLSLSDILPLCQSILSSERLGTHDCEKEFADAYLGCLASHFSQHRARLVQGTSADEKPLVWVEMTILPHNGAEYWRPPNNPFYTQWSLFNVAIIPWEWHCSPLLGADYHRKETDSQPYWRKFQDCIDNFLNRPRPKKGMAVTVRAPISDIFNFVKGTEMAKQMRRLHFMFRPPENSSEPPPVKVKTWAGEEDESDMLLRGPKDEDHYLPERPYRPWPEEIVRSFKADGVNWDIRIS